MKYTQTSKNNKTIVEFQIHKDFEELTSTFMSYELLNWTLRERCTICTNQKNCEIKKETCLAAGENYPYQSIYWLIICPHFEIRQFSPHSLIQCAKFDHIQTRLFPLSSDEQQNFLLNEMM